MITFCSSNIERSSLVIVQKKSLVEVSVLTSYQSMMWGNTMGKAHVVVLPVLELSLKVTFFCCCFGENINSWEFLISIFPNPTSRRMERWDSYKFIFMSSKLPLISVNWLFCLIQSWYIHQFFLSFLPPLILIMECNM